MKYRLSIDLGSSSIAICPLLLDEENKVLKIIDMAVRIFDASRGAETRRQKRTVRKCLKRRQKRLERLAELLFKNGLWVNPSPEGTRRIRACSPYELRAKALDSKLEDPCFIGRILLHLAKHRGAGFISAASEMEEEAVEKTTRKKTSPYDRMIQFIQETDSRTVGEFFYKRICESYKTGNPDLRTVRRLKYAVEARIVDYAVPRYLVKDEFNRIWETQASFYPQMNAPGLKEEVCRILFFEHPGVPYAVGRCIYFKNEERLLKAHRISELRRIYEAVNNIRLLTKTDKIRLSPEQRDKIIEELLLKGESAGKRSISNLLGLPKDCSISIDEDKSAPIKPYLYATEAFTKIPFFSSLSDEDFDRFIEFVANPVNPNDKEGRLYTEDELIEKLKDLLNVSDERLIGELLTKLPKGRGMLGLSASKAILAELKNNVLSQREVTDRLAVSDPRYTAEEELARQTQGSCCSLPYYGKILTTDTQPISEWMCKNNPYLDEDEKEYGKIPNPAVHMLLNQLRRVVNDVIRIYGRPYDINIEVARDVGMSEKRKNAAESRRKANEKLNDKAREYLSRNRLFINRSNILKYKLAEEQGWKDAFSPWKSIPQRFEGFEVEHLIPRAKGGSDTMNNLVLIDANENSGKGDNFAYDYFQKSKSDEEIREILKFARARLKKKSWRFEPDAREKFEDSGDSEETNRFLLDTRYVSKLALRYLRTIVDCTDAEEAAKVRILPVRGAQTADLRTRWNLDGLEYELLGLNVPRYLPCAPYYLNRDTGEILSGSVPPDIDGPWERRDKKKNPEWEKKPRIDHRHHALDALVVGCLNRSFLQLWATRENSGRTLRREDFPVPMVGITSDKAGYAAFRESVLQALKKTPVSHKAEHSPRGQLHEETGKAVLVLLIKNPAGRKKEMLLFRPREIPEALEKYPEAEKTWVTVYSREVSKILKKKTDLEKLRISSSIDDTWDPKIREDREKQAQLIEAFTNYYPRAEKALEEKRNRDVAEGSKSYDISEAMVLNEAFRMIRKDGLWKGGKVRKYENLKSAVYIPKHRIVYKAGNNYCVDFYDADGKVGWEMTNRFDANQEGYVPEWRKKGAKALWHIQQGDLLELRTPEEWKTYTDKEKCLARVKKFSEGKVGIDFVTDARMTSPAKKELSYMKVDTLENRGLSFFTEHKARKIELTPFGKIRRRHKALWDGSKKAS